MTGNAAYLLCGQVKLYYFSFLKCFFYILKGALRCKHLGNMKYAKYGSTCFLLGMRPFQSEGYSTSCKAS